MSELLSIKVSDIEFERRRIRVLGKGSRERYVVFGPLAATAVRTYLNGRANPAIAAPGVMKSDARDRKNTLAVSGKDLRLSCPKYIPIQNVTVADSDVAALRYGQNAVRRLLI